jgi:hypothetical protein
MGAHAIKKGLGFLINGMVRNGWITHVAMNGAASIHDWELAYLMETSEDVKENMEHGCFGMWEDTGRWINMAIRSGVCFGLGYADSIGKFINEGLGMLPNPSHISLIQDFCIRDFTRLVTEADLRKVEHRGEYFSVQAQCYQMGARMTVHPMFGHDIIYMHPLCSGFAIGLAAERDFMLMADSISKIQGGVFISMASAVMSPMVFEKCFSMAQNIAVDEGGKIENHSIFVVDMIPSGWDWSQGEPPEDNHEYYMRFNKSFSRTGGSMKYISCDVHDFLFSLYHELK